MSKHNLKFGIVGTGGRGRNFGRMLNDRDDTVVAALCDPNHVRMEEAVKKLKGDQACYATAEEMLDENPDLDSVIITSPDCWHADNAVAALERGINALIDKPLATTVQGCQRIIEASKRHDKIAMVGFNLRHDPTMQRLKQIVEDGILGRVFMITNMEFYDGGRTYMSRWNRKYEISGGLWVHKGSHDFDAFQWLLGFPKPTKVSAFAGINVFTPDNIPFELKPGTEVGPTCSECMYKQTCPDVYKIDNLPEWSQSAREVDGYSKDLCMYTSDKDVHDNGIALVEYENGARASHAECFVTSLGDRLYTLVGDKGQAEVSLHNRTITVRPRWKDKSVTHDIPPTQGGHGGADPVLVDTFVRTLKGEIPNESTLEHGMWSTAVGQAAEISRRQDRTVKIEELF